MTNLTNNTPVTFSLNEIFTPSTVIAALERVTAKESKALLENAISCISDAAIAEADLQITIDKIVKHCQTALGKDKISTSPVIAAIELINLVLLAGNESADQLAKNTSNHSLYHKNMTLVRQLRNLQNRLSKVETEKGRYTFRKFTAKMLEGKKFDGFSDEVKASMTGTYYVNFAKLAEPVTPGTGDDTGTDERGADTPPDATGEGSSDSDDTGTSEGGNTPPAADSQPQDQNGRTDTETQVGILAANAKQQGIVRDLMVALLDTGDKAVQVEQLAELLVHVSDDVRLDAVTVASKRLESLAA